MGSLAHNNHEVLSCQDYSHPATYQSSHADVLPLTRRNARSLRVTASMPRAMVVVWSSDSSAASAAKKRFVPPQAAAHRCSAARHASGLLFGDKAGT